MREIIQTKQFKKDYKKIASSGRYSLKDFLTVVERLAQDESLPDKYRDHGLVGEWKGCKECHIKPDWLLIYQKDDKTLILVRTGSHSDLFA
jgi:addiction module toxin component, YafQ family/addiction module toxin, RelE/StbE family